ncbi:hypothetical protein MRX96_054814 [Rhipicephalus microplus]
MVSWSCAATYWVTSCTSFGLQTVRGIDATGTICVEHGIVSPEAQAVKRPPSLLSRLHQATPWVLPGLKRHRLSSVPLANAALRPFIPSMNAASKPALPFMPGLGLLDGQDNPPDNLSPTTVACLHSQAIPFWFLPIACLMGMYHARKLIAVASLVSSLFARTFWLCS